MKFVRVPGTSVLFCIWETRVQDFNAFVTATGYDAGDAWRAPLKATAAAIPADQRASFQAKQAGFRQTGLHPVSMVNWYDAAAFCRWLTEQERANGHLHEGQIYRLPTDDEWSRAVGLPHERGATPQQKSMKIEGFYPWGTSFPPPPGSGNYSGEGDGWTGEINGYSDGARFACKVGSYAPNRFGLYDMGGNVWEWCSDRFRSDRKGRVMRGASMVQGAPSYLLSSARAPRRPDSRDYFNLGFRCVLTVNRPSP